MPVLASDGSGNQLEPIANLALAGVVSPTALTGDVNNYNPTSLATATVLRVDPGGASRNMTGLTAQAHGKLILLLNIADGAEDLVLVNQSGSSDAANRFYGANNANVTIRRGGGCLLLYDGVDARWKPVAI